MIRRLQLARLEDRLTPATATWDGGGADNHWTTAANWVGDIAPNPGDDLVFPVAAAQTVNVNDFAAGTAFHSLTLSGDGYQLTGNAVSFMNGINVFIATNATNTLSLALGGAGGLNKDGAGTLILSGSNSYTGLTTITAGNRRPVSMIANLLDVDKWGTLFKEFATPLNGCGRPAIIDLARGSNPTCSAAGSPSH
jgi:autotransporter-associated beta strand protein